MYSFTSITPQTLSPILLAQQCDLSPVYTGDKVVFKSTRSTLWKVDCCRNLQRIGNNVNSTSCPGRLCYQCVPGFTWRRSLPIHNSVYCYVLQPGHYVFTLSVPVVSLSVLMSVPCQHRRWP